MPIYAVCCSIVLIPSAAWPVSSWGRQRNGCRGGQLVRASHCRVEALDHRRLDSWRCPGPETQSCLAEEVWQVLQSVCPGVHLAQFHDHLPFHHKELEAAFGPWLPELRKLKQRWIQQAPCRRSDLRSPQSASFDGQTIQPNPDESVVGQPHKDLLSGLVVAFAMIPEAIAFSGIAGVDPKVGLFGAFCLSLTIAVVGGRMAMITSATGSTALLMTGLVATGEPGARPGGPVPDGGGAGDGSAADPLGVSASCLSDALCSPRGAERLR